MQHLTEQDGFAYLYPDFLAPESAESLFSSLKDKLPWQRETYTVYGKTVTAPRWVCWYGDPNAVYSYSGVQHVPLPWRENLLQIKHKIEHKCGHQFNSVLCNLYENGRHSMGWHADKEAELGKNPYIASLSLGETRLFKLRHTRSKKTINVNLQSGSLLLMGGEFQHHWQHALPKTQKPKQTRINLTYRKIMVC